MYQRRDHEALQDRAQVLEKLELEITPPGALHALGCLGLRTADLSLLLPGRSRGALYNLQDGVSLPPAQIAEYIDDARYAALSLLRGNEKLPLDILAGWLRCRSRGLDGQRPLTALGEGRFEEVLEVGRQETAALGAR